MRCRRSSGRPLFPGLLEVSPRGGRGGAIADHGHELDERAHVAIAALDQPAPGHQRGGAEAHSGLGGPIHSPTWDCASPTAAPATRRSPVATMGRPGGARPGCPAVTVALPGRGRRGRSHHGPTTRPSREPAWSWVSSRVEQRLAMASDALALAMDAAHG
jgi:hypothetical protein